jgi:phosphoribosyl 1,2-cyclic phosphodiesterase
VKLTFLGTRGEIELRTRRHRMHSSLLVSYRGHAVMIDCGDDWLSQLTELKPPVLLITHAHPDHAGGLRKGAPCPVYATADTWEGIASFPIDERRLIKPRRPMTIQGIVFEAFTVEHSLRAPAVGYRMTAGHVTAFYSPDVVYIHDRSTALRGARLLIGDGATMTRPLIRRRGQRLIGHVPVRTQLTWCQREGVPRMIITHCGSQIVGGDERKLKLQVDELARNRNVTADIAHDGLTIVLR